MDLPTLIRNYKSCHLCHLGRQSPIRVHYRGDVPCDLLFVGEGLGDQEIAHREPFIGNAGKELNRWIDETLPSTQLSYAITNSVICPPQDSPHDECRAPKHSEIEACNERLYEFVKLCNPCHIVALGRVAEKAVKLLNLEYPSFTFIYHPSFILKQGERAGRDRAKALYGLRQAINTVLSDLYV